MFGSTSSWGRRSIDPASFGGTRETRVRRCPGPHGWVRPEPASTDGLPSVGFGRRLHLPRSAVRKIERDGHLAGDLIRATRVRAGSGSQASHPPMTSGCGSGSDDDASIAGVRASRRADSSMQSGKDARPSVLCGLLDRSTSPCVVPKRRPSGETEGQLTGTGRIGRVSHSTKAWTPRVPPSRSIDWESAVGASVPWTGDETRGVASVSRLGLPKSPTGAGAGHRGSRRLWRT